MLAKARIGFVVGILGLILSGLISGFKGISGTLLSLGASGIAGFLAVRLAKLSSRGTGARLGALAGGIAGFTVALGQLIGAAVSLISLSPQENILAQIAYYLVSAGIGIFLVVIIILIMAGIGAGAGLIVTPRQPPTNNPPA